MQPLLLCCLKFARPVLIAAALYDCVVSVPGVSIQPIELSDGDEQPHPNQEVMVLEVQGHYLGCLPPMARALCPVMVFCPTEEGQSYVSQEVSGTVITFPNQLWWQDP